MSSILSIEHSARVSSWDEPRRALQQAKKLPNRAKIACFIAFNIAVWALILSPVIFW